MIIIHRILTILLHNMPTHTLRKPIMIIIAHGAFYMTLGLEGKYEFVEFFSIDVYSGSGSYCLPVLASICLSNEKGFVITPRACCSCQRRAARIDLVLRIVFASIKAQMTPRN